MSLFNVAPVTVDDYRRIAQRRLPKFLFDYIDGGANREEILARNCADFSQLQLKQRVLRDVGSIDTATTLFGRSMAMPVALAPVGMAGLFRRRGETQAARAAERCGIPFATSTVGVCPVDEVAASVAEPIWFQLYMLRDRDFVLEMLERARNAGVDILLFTVDLPVPGMRQRDFRNGMIGGGTAGKISKLAQILSSPRWIYDVGLRGKPHTFGNVASKVENPKDLDLYKSFIDGQFDPTVTWSDIAWLRQQWHGKLIIKGVMESDDALGLMLPFELTTSTLRETLKHCRESRKLHLESWCRLSSQGIPWATSGDRGDATICMLKTVLLFLSPTDAEMILHLFLKPGTPADTIDEAKRLLPSLKVAHLGAVVSPEEFERIEAQYAADRCIIVPGSMTDDALMELGDLFPDARQVWVNQSNAVNSIKMAGLKVERSGTKP